MSSVATPLAASALRRGRLAQVDDGLAVGGIVPFGDADPALDPLVVGVDTAGDQVGVGDDVGRPEVAEPEDARGW